MIQTVRRLAEPFFFEIFHRRKFFIPRQNGAFTTGGLSFNLEALKSENIMWFCEPYFKCA